MKLPNLLLPALVVVACGKKSEDTPPAPQPPSAEAVAQAKTVFTQRCVPCHGATGTGDGPASATLDPKPRNYTNTAWQDSVDDAYLEKIIKFGGAGVGKSPAMPNNPDLSPEVITALKDVVRSFNKK